MKRFLIIFLALVSVAVAQEKPKPTKDNRFLNPLRTAWNMQKCVSNNKLDPKKAVVCLVDILEKEAASGKNSLVNTLNSVSPQIMDLLNYHFSAEGLQNFLAGQEGFVGGTYEKLSEMKNQFDAWKEDANKIRLKRQDAAANQKTPRNDKKRSLPLTIPAQILLFKHVVEQCVQASKDKDPVKCAVSIFGPEVSAAGELIRDIVKNTDPKVIELVKQKREEIHQVLSSQPGFVQVIHEKGHNAVDKIKETLQNFG